MMNQTTKIMTNHEKSIQIQQTHMVYRNEIQSIPK